MDKREKTAKAKQEDVLLTKMLYWIVGAVVLEFLLLLLNRFYVNYTASGIELAVGIHSVLTVLAVVFPICFVGTVVWLWQSHKRGKVCNKAPFLVALTAALSVCTIVSRLYRGTGVSLLYVMVPVVAVLAMVYYLYQREFFGSAILCALGLLGVRLCAQSRSVKFYAFMFVLAVILVVAVLASRMMQKHAGALKLGGKSYAILPKTTNYAFLYVTCAVVALVVIAALIMGVHVVLYGVLVAWLLILAVYYTVKLM